MFFNYIKPLLTEWFFYVLPKPVFILHFYSMNTSFPFDNDLWFDTEALTLIHSEANKLENAIKNAISSSYVETVNSTGALLRGTSVKFNEEGSLDRLDIYGPRHAFILNHGVETIATSKTNRRKNYRLDIKKTNHIAIALETANTIENIANGLATISANQLAEAFNHLPDKI